MRRHLTMTKIPSPRLPVQCRRYSAAQGRVACEIASGDELIATEIIFGGILNELSPAEAAALLSALVFQVPQPFLPEFLSVILAQQHASPD